MDGSITWVYYRPSVYPVCVVQCGGKPNPGTPKDKRLKENRPPTATVRRSLPKPTKK